MAESEAPAAAEAQPAAAKGANPLIPIILVVVLVPAICYAMVEFIFMPRLLKAAGAVAEANAEKAQTTRATHPPKETTMDFGRSMVTLAGSGGSRYLRVNIVLASPNPALEQIIKSNEVALRDATITVLSSLSLSQIEGADGRDVVRRALMSRLNAVLGQDVIQQIYFTEFVIQ